MATISVTRSNFSCVSARPCTLMVSTRIRSTSPGCKNDGREHSLGAFSAILGFGVGGTHQIPWFVRARLAYQQSQHIHCRERRILRSPLRDEVYYRCLLKPCSSRPAAGGEKKV